MHTMQLQLCQCIAVHIRVRLTSILHSSGVQCHANKYTIADTHQQHTHHKLQTRGFGAQTHSPALHTAQAREEWHWCPTLSRPGVSHST